jgi:predicted ATPase/DNA-binding CsgD family transcriptional regulator
MVAMLYNSFTEREMEVLRLVALGLSNQDIANELVIAVETVRWYTKQIYSKLGVHGRVPALVQANELGLLDDHAPLKPEKVPSTDRPIHHNLPAPTSSFIGRVNEIDEVKCLLRASRLLTLTGGGGIGKTRLALQTVQELADEFPDGVYFVDLAPISAAAQMPHAITRALGVFENPKVSILETLRHALAGREMLLLLDNFEHVIQASILVSELMAALPSLKILITSREPLRLTGEQEYLVPPLSLPSTDKDSIDQIMASEAGILFLKRAQLVAPRFTISAENAPFVVQICTRLDGLPLAIELAAARCKLLSPQGLLKRLDRPLTILTGGSRDAPLRQRTLRDALEWSYNLLNKAEKTLFARLSVFWGSCSLEAIETVCAPNLSIDVLDGLASLVDKNLVQQHESLADEPRFTLLETVREYSSERLETSGEEEAIRQRHAEYFVDLAERAEPELRLAQQMRWFRLLDIERENIRAALEWSMRQGKMTVGVRLAGALWHFWWVYGYHVEALNWMERLLPRLSETPEQYHPQFLIGAGNITTLHNAKRGRALLSRSVEIARQSGNRLQEAWALTYGADMLPKDTAFASITAGLALFREIDHKPGIAQALNNLGVVAHIIGDDDDARRAYQDCIMLCEQTGDIRLLSTALHNRSFISQREGHHQEAIALLRRSLMLCQALGNRSDMAMIMQTLAGSLGESGLAEPAARLLGAAEMALERMGAIQDPLDRSDFEHNTATVRKQLEDAVFMEALASGRRMSMEKAVGLALELSDK